MQWTIISPWWFDFFFVNSTIHTHTHTHNHGYPLPSTNEKKTLWQLCKYELCRSVQRKKKGKKNSYKSRCYITCPKEIFVAMPSSVITLGRRKSAENLENTHQQSAVRAKGKIQVGRHNQHAPLLRYSFATLLSESPICFFLPNIPVGHVNGVGL